MHSWEKKSFWERIVKPELYRHFTVCKEKALTGLWKIYLIAFHKIVENSSLFHLVSDVMKSVHFRSLEKEWNRVIKRALDSNEYSQMSKWDETKRCCLATVVVSGGHRWTVSLSEERCLKKVMKFNYYFFLILVNLQTTIVGDGKQPAIKVILQIDIFLVVNNTF